MCMTLHEAARVQKEGKMVNRGSLGAWFCCVVSLILMTTPCSQHPHFYVTPERACPL